jgi:ElaB/YqjD/DUF883 family membrane-anchored ribosome-binding protein
MNDLPKNVEDAAKKLESKVEAKIESVEAAASRNVHEVRRALHSNADQVKETASNSLLKAAENIRREAAQSGHPEAVQHAQELAHSMERAAVYLDSHSFDQIGTDLTNVVSERPWQTVLVALIIGIVLGSIFGGRRD